MSILIRIVVSVLFSCGLLQNAACETARPGPVEVEAIIRLVREGEAFVQICMTIERGWYVYGIVDGEGGQEALAIKIQLPPKVSAIGGLIWEGGADSGGCAILTGTWIFTQHISLQHVQDLSQIRVAIRYQPCSRQNCLAPISMELPVKVEGKQRRTG